jgi:autotransporter-associated beta strand protein
MAPVISRQLGRIVLLSGLLCASGAFAQDGYWVNPSGGSWANGGNWDSANGIAGGADNTAYFGFSREAVISANATFTFDGSQTIGNLFFTTQGPANWSFNSNPGGSLTLENTFGPPHVTITSPSLQVTLNAAVAGNSGLEKDGPGTLNFNAANTYAGPTTVNGGTIGGTGTISGPVVIAKAGRSPSAIRAH